MSNTFLDAKSYPVRDQTFSFKEVWKDYPKDSTNYGRFLSVTANLLAARMSIDQVYVIHEPGTKNATALRELTIEGAPLDVIRYDCDRFFQFSEEQNTSVLAHELAHIALNHTDKQNTPEFFSHLTGLENAKIEGMWKGGALAVVLLIMRTSRCFRFISSAARYVGLGRLFSTQNRLVQSFSLLQSSAQKIFSSLTMPASTIFRAIQNNHFIEHVSGFFKPTIVFLSTRLTELAVVFSFGSVGAVIAAEAYEEKTGVMARVRSHEHEADILAARLVGKEAIKDLLIKLHEGGGDVIPDNLSTHPSLEERLHVLDTVDLSRVNDLPVGGDGFGGPRAGQGQGNEPTPATAQQR
jgi:Peptidase family M48